MNRSPGKQTAITARCLCGAHVYKAAVSESSLPLKAVACHCDSCRRQTGGLYFVDTTWPPCLDDPRSDGGVDVSRLKRYDFSKNIALFSCATCSTLLFCKGPEHDDPLCVLVGALDPTALGTVAYEDHIFVGDTLDGGAAALLLRNGDGSAIGRWRARRAGESEKLGADWPAAEGRTSRAPSRPEAKAGPAATRAACVCGGVGFSIRSAADLATGGEAEARSAGRIEEGTGRYRALICACDQCRLFFSAELTALASVPLSHIEYASGGDQRDGREKMAFPQSVAALKAAVDENCSRGSHPALGTLRYYKSSEKVERYFCGICSASVFYATRDQPDVIQVGVGLLQSPGGGALSESLLAWDYGDIEGRADVAGSWREALISAILSSEEWKARQSA